jgi:hypothetical protein
MDGDYLMRSSAGRSPFQLAAFIAYGSLDAQQWLVYNQLLSVK